MSVAKGTWKSLAEKISGAMETAKRLVTKRIRKGKRKIVCGNFRKLTHPHSLTSSKTNYRGFIIYLVSVSTFWLYDIRSFRQVFLSKNKHNLTYFVNSHLWKQELSFLLIFYNCKKDNSTSIILFSSTM